MRPNRPLSNLHICVTGASGFIGGTLVRRLIKGFPGVKLSLSDFWTSHPKCMVPDLPDPHSSSPQLLSPIELPRYLRDHPAQVIFHLGAITDTAETNESKLATWNTRYSQMLWNLAAHHGSNLIYASSAATYGDGRLGYSDDHGRLSELRPLNAYGWSKQRFDVWALSQPSGPPFWVGWKFFNVYGPGESHKGRMASVVWHASKQLREKGVIELFRSHRHDVADGKQKRDFVFVDDVVDRLLACIAPPKEIPSGIYNLGTGKARTFLDVATGVATALNHPLKVEWIETPPEFREHYQYWTQADMEKAHAAGFSSTYTPLASGIRASLAT